MKGILIVGHGNLPRAFEEALKMIAGDLPSIHHLGLSPEEGPEDLKKKLSDLLTVLNSYEHVTVFGDLFGGSPLNTIFQMLSHDARYSFISGMNFPMLLTAALSTESTTEELIAIGLEGIKDLNDPEKNSVVPPSIEQTLPGSKNEPHQLIHVRVDSRGIHGQVATAWIPTLEVNRVIVIDDQAIHNATQKMALKMARPNHTKLSILSTATAITRLNDPFSYPSEKILVLIQSVDTLQTLADKGYYFKQVNLGNVPNRENTEKFLRTIYLTPSEVTTLENLNISGTTVTAQMVPNDPIIDFQNLLSD